MRGTLVRHPRTFALLLPLLAACHGSEAPTEVIGPAPVPNLGSQSVTLSAGATSAEYMAVVENTLLDGTTVSSFTLLGTGLGASASLVAGQPAPSRSVLFDGAAAPLPDQAFEERIRSVERAELTGRIPAAQAWYAARRAAAPQDGLTPGVRSAQAIPTGAKVGDIIQVNVQLDSACNTAVYHPARIAAIGQRAMILEDTLNPRGGFTTADYQRYAARFDTLVYPLDSAAFGAPTDIDNNGHIALVFTRAVNEETPRNSSFFIGGLTFSRDLFPLVGTSRAQACPTSNEGEYFYLLAPDPLGTINGNVRSTGFVDSTTTAVIAHEFQHLINAGRRLYVNQASAFEVKWLDEGLAHIAEELLFYRESGVRSRTNVNVDTLRSSARKLYAYNRDMNGNQARYRSYLERPSTSSPVAPDDELTTRGGAWSMLRYLADRAGSTDGDFFFRLVNSRSTGVTNLTAVYGTGLAVAVRDWNVSHAADDVAPIAEYQQPSWNWHSILPAVTTGSVYPLAYQPMANGTSYSGSARSGGAAYYKITVPANSSATLSLTEQSGATSTLSLVTVRTK